MYTPVALFAILLLFGQDIPYLGNLTSCSLAVYPVIEPIIAMTCISAFRRATISKIILIYYDYEQAFNSTDAVTCSHSVSPTTAVLPVLVSKYRNTEKQL